MEAERGGMRLQAKVTKERWRPPEARRGPRIRSFPRAFRGSVDPSTPWFQTSSFQNYERINFCFKFVALCYSSPGELIQPCSQKSVVWGGDLSWRRCVLHPPFPPPCGWNVSPMGWAGRATWDREWKLNMEREMSHAGRSSWQPRRPGTAESLVTWKWTPTLFMPLSFGGSYLFLLNLTLFHPGRQICKWNDAIQRGK